MFRYLFSIISLLFVTISPCVGDIVAKTYVDGVRDNLQTAIDNKVANSNYTQNMVLQTDNSGNVVATTVGTDLLADGTIETMHLTDGAVTNADLAGMIDITKLNLGTLPTSGKHMMIWNAETQKYVFERYVTSTMPADYTELEYIESTGTQWLDTGYVVNTTTSAELGINMNVVTGDVILGYCVNDGGGDCWRLFNHNSTLYFDMGGMNTRIIGPDNSFPVGVYQEIKVGNFYVQNLTKGVGASDTIRSSIYTPAHSMTLFHDVDHSSNSIGKVYYLKVFDDNSLVHSFVPAKRNSDGVIGMYDTVTETFFTNSGTGSFIAGPEI